MTEVLAAGPTPTGGTGSASPTLPPSSPTPDTESLASTGSTGTAAVGLLAAVLAGAGALLVLARRRSAR
ncbi:MAG TPA: LPXTG cell wall anchor domain-containing protein [Cellulomonas sp.]|nr:LPXTG cell wall anchor domain-containing protein [Cellulomonas sp.]